MRRTLPLIAIALAAAGCHDAAITSNTVIDESTTRTAARTPDAGAAYTCSDGRVVHAEFLDAQNLTLHMGNKDVLMQATTSTKGARFVGGGWQWWVNDLADTTLRRLPAGRTVATTGGLTCKVT